MAEEKLAVTEGKARTLAMRIEKFWHDRGHKHIKVMAIYTTQTQTWIIHSNLTGYEPCELVPLYRVKL